MLCASNIQIVFLKCLDPDIYAFSLPSPMCQLKTEMFPLPIIYWGFLKTENPL